jgi:hypothetical protein
MAVSPVDGAFRFGDRLETFVEPASVPAQIAEIGPGN